MKVDFQALTRRLRIECEQIDGQRLNVRIVGAADCERATRKNAKLRRCRQRVEAHRGDDGNRGCSDGGLNVNDDDATRIGIRKALQMSIECENRVLEIANRRFLLSCSDRKLPLEQQEDDRKTATGAVSKDKRATSRVAKK